MKKIFTRTYIEFLFPLTKLLIISLSINDGYCHSYELIKNVIQEISSHNTSSFLSAILGIYHVYAEKYV